MLTIEEAKKFFNNYGGEDVEYKDLQSDDWRVGKLIGVIADCDLAYLIEYSRWRYCRPIPKKEMRLTTGFELRGKWLSLSNEPHETKHQITQYYDAGIHINGAWISIAGAYQHGFKIEGARSLMVEV